MSIEVLKKLVNRHQPQARLALTYPLAEVLEDSLHRRAVQLYMKQWEVELPRVLGGASLVDGGFDDIPARERVCRASSERVVSVGE